MPSQKKVKSNSQLVVDDDDGAGSSQKQGNLSKKEFERKVNEVIRYILFHDRKMVGLKRADLTKNVLKEHAKLYTSIIKEVTLKLETIFGYKLVEMETADGKPRGLILINKIDKVVDDEVSSLLEEEDEKSKLGLLTTILSLIFMNEGPITEVSLYHTLNKFGLYKDREHEVFGNVEKLISQEFVKLNYIERQKVQGHEGPTYQYNWGCRSHKEISKRNILEFVSEIYGVESIEDWRIQYQEVVESENVVWENDFF